VAFPYLFAIACAKDASLVAHLELYGGSNQWNASFVKAAHDWEVDIFASGLFFFLICCTLLEQDRKVNTSFDGSPLKRGCSLLAPSIRSLFVMVAFLFLERVFG